jgi:hypothetical protein
MNSENRSLAAAEKLSARGVRLGESLDAALTQTQRNHGELGARTTVKRNALSGKSKTVECLGGKSKTVECLGRTIARNKIERRSKGICCQFNS